MKPQKSDTTVEGNMTGEVIHMAIDKTAMRHIMSLFTDLYSDQEAAVIREVSTNARDSMIAAGRGDFPIEVFLPTTFNPVLRIKDTGLGLDEEDIRRVYSLYGASTKRDTNDQTGALGLGCKSPLTYTQQFSVVGIKDGVRTMISIGRDEDGGGSMTVVEQKPTDDPNGVEVIVPTKRESQFKSKAASFFRFWEDGKVLVDGEEPEKISGLRISDTMLLMMDAGDVYGGPINDFVVMGGVPYPVSEDYSLRARALGGNNARYSLVTIVPIGSVDFTPSREALMYTTRTKNKLEELKGEYEYNARKAVETDLAKAATTWEALEKSLEWRSALSLKAEILKYKGKDVPTDVIYPGAEATASWDTNYSHGEQAIFTEINSYKMASSTDIGKWGAENFPNTVWIHGFDVKFTAQHKKKLKQYLSDQKMTGRYFVLSKQEFDWTWIDPARVIPWSKIKDIKIVSESGTIVSGKRLSGSYEAYVKYVATQQEKEYVEKYGQRNVEYNKERGSHVGELEAHKINQKSPIIYYTKEMFGDRHFNYIAMWVRKSYPTATFVNLGLNRVDKFKRDFPKAIDAHKALTDAWHKLVKKVGVENLEAVELQSDRLVKEFLKSLDTNKVVDPELHRAIKLVNKNVAKASNDLKEFERSGLTTWMQKPDEVTAPDIETRYPLIAGCGSLTLDDEEELKHVYLYLNEAYRQLVK